MIWQPEFTDKTLSRKPGAVHQESEERMDAGGGLRKLQRGSSRHNGLYRWILQRTKTARI
ncbi:hypothetical protein CBL22_24335 [Shigella flexneri]|nr:hypothetical protein CBL22_24335 [Shigella flexneri]